MKYLLIFLISFSGFARSELPRPNKKELNLPQPTRERKFKEQRKDRTKIPKPSREFSLPLK